MNGADEIKQLDAAGFPAEEIAAWSANRRQELSAAGFNKGEIDTYFGAPPFNPKPVQTHIEENLKAATEPAKNFTEALEAGFQMSVTGLLSRQEAPTKTLPEDAPRMSRIASQVGTLAG